MQERSSGLAPLIAIIGTDGSGKSTVSERVVKFVGRYGSAAQAHLGKQSGNLLRALGRIPLVGQAMHTRVRRKVTKESGRIDANVQPGLLAALVISAFTLRRLRRFKRMLALRRQGMIIVTDRFPQVAVPLAYDGPGFPDNPNGSRLVLALARRERAAFEWMASFQPDLVLRLNVDLDTACARKPDHLRDALRRKIEVTPLLTYGSAPIVDIDASRPLDQVISAAETAVAQVLSQRGYSPGQ